MVDVTRDDLHEVVVRAARGMALDDVRLPTDPGMERIRLGIRLLVQRHLHEGGHA